MFTTTREPDTLLLRDDEFSDPALCAQPDLPRVGLELFVLSLLGVRTHSLGKVPDLLGLVDSLRFSEGFTGGVVANECD